MLGDSRSFDPKAVALLLAAFDEIVADLNLRTDADREKAAKIVMRLALGQTELDAAEDPRRSRPFDAKGRREGAETPVLTRPQVAAVAFTPSPAAITARQLLFGAPRIALAVRLRKICLRAVRPLRTTGSRRYSQSEQGRS
jgi:hypothetical protein